MVTEKRRIPIGFQLYTVRGEFSRDVPRTLTKLAEIGYQAVEFWGYGGTANVYKRYSAKELRQMLDDLGLKCCGTHLKLKALAKENLERTIENNQILGSEYLNVAMARKEMGSEKGIAGLAELLNQRVLDCRPHGMRVGYHAHGFDFKKIGGQFAWDLLFSRLSPEVNMQLDPGNALAGKGDPIGMLKKFPGRAHTLHLKEYGQATFDSKFYDEVFRLCEAGGTKWYIVEMGGLLGNGFRVPKRALEKLRGLGKV